MFQQKIFAFLAMLAMVISFLMNIFMNLKLLAIGFFRLPITVSGFAFGRA